MLAGLGFYKVQQRKKAAPLDSSFLQNGLNPESFFDNSGGQKIDTSESLATGSSMVYSPSQIDAVDDVDPVAEADVYLAYGRDLQAEEILKDALRTQPERLAIHQKLLEIYSKRRDAKAYEAMATMAFNLTNGTGTEWEKICESGRLLDPENSLYLPGGHPVPTYHATAAIVAAQQANAQTSSDVAQAKEEQNSVTENDNSLDLDLDLDFSLDDPAPEPSVVIAQIDPLPTFDLDFNDEATQAIESTSVATALPEPDPSSKASADEADQADDEINFDQTVATPSASLQPADEPQPTADSGMLEFDLGSLSLDLGDNGPLTESGVLENAPEDPLATKLALAEEFQAIGDDDGARALIEEVIAEAAGDMKTKAQRALSRL
jgi:pilus assembly protein FimV